jgi:hypothetical protein
MENPEVVQALSVDVAVSRHFGTSGFGSLNVKHGKLLK